MNFVGTWCTADLNRAYSQHDPRRHINTSCPSPFALLTISYPPKIQARTAAPMDEGSLHDLLLVLHPWKSRFMEYRCAAAYVGVVDLGG